MFDRYPTPLHLSTFDMNIGPISVAKGFATNVGPAALTWTANLAVYVPVFLPWPYTVNRVFWVNGSTVGSNVNMGVFTKAGRILYETGSTAQSAVNVAQYVTPSTRFVLPQGEYYFGLTCDGTTNRLCGAGLAVISLAHMGVLQQASNFALSDPAVFAFPTVAAFPQCGVTRTSSGF